LISFITGHEIRIGFPVQHLNSEVQDDVNQPMFSTSIGLMMIGHEKMLKTNTETVGSPATNTEISEKTTGVTDDTEIDDKSEKKKKKQKRPKVPGERNKFIDRLSSFFDDSDTKINE